MPESFEVNGRKFEIAPSAKLRAFEAHVTETGRMLSTLDTILDRLERTVPETMSARTVGPDIRRVAREELVNAASLLVEVVEHVGMAIEESRDLIDNVALSEEAQATTLEKLLTLSSRYERAQARLKSFSTRFGMKLP